MKKSILALTLVAALSMLGACSSNDNNGSTGVSGNFAKEPISKAKLELWKLGEVGVTGKKALGETETSTTGSFNFGVDPNGVYVAKVALNGLANASLMNKEGGTKIVGNTVTVSGYTMDADSVIIVPANSSAQFNPLGLLATDIIVEATGINPLGALSATDIANANALVSYALNNIYTNLSALTLAANNNVSTQTIASANWSANKEFAIQLALLIAADPAGSFNFDELVDDDFVIDPADLTAEIITKALALANAAADATGQPQVTREPVNHKEIVKTFLFNKNATTPEMFLPLINATNATAYKVNGTALGANASLNLEIALNKLNPFEVAGQARLIPATAVDASTITPSNAGIKAKAGTKGSEFGYDIDKGINGTYTTIVRATYANGTTTRNSLVFNINATPSDTNSTDFLNNK